MRAFVISDLVQRAVSVPLHIALRRDSRTAGGGPAIHHRGRADRRSDRALLARGVDRGEAAPSPLRAAARPVSSRASRAAPTWLRAQITQVSAVANTSQRA